MVKKASCALAAAKRLAARADAENIHPQQAWIDSARTKPVALPARPRLVRVLRILGAAFERNLDDEAAARSTSLPPRRAMNRVEGDFVAARSKLCDEERDERWVTECELTDAIHRRGRGARRGWAEGEGGPHR